MLLSIWYELFPGLASECLPESPKRTCGMLLDRLGDRQESNGNVYAVRQTCSSRLLQMASEEAKNDKGQPQGVGRWYNSAMVC